MQSLYVSSLCSVAHQCHCVALFAIACLDDVFRTLLAPGMMLQLNHCEPDNEQLEVAIVALHEALGDDAL